MAYDSESLFALLPAIHRIRDSENGGALKELLTLISVQLNALEEDIEQLYDNAFIETAAPWAVPYIGDLIGYRELHGAKGSLRSTRAEVANTIAYRRRKGTAAVLEQLARDVTGWEAVVVEYFLRLATTQHFKHLRPATPCTVDLRKMEPLERLGSAFDRVLHQADVRRIESGRGRHNISNIGIFLSRLQDYSWTELRATPAAPGDQRRFLFHPLGINLPLFTLPVTETSIAHLAGPENVPLRLTRREFDRRLPDYYGLDRSLEIIRRIVLPPGSLGPDLIPIPAAEIESCNLADLDPDPDTSTWPPGHPTRVSVDPELGRIRFPADEIEIFVSFHYGFSSAVGGGEYSRLDTFAAQTTGLTTFPGTFPNLQAALDSAAGTGCVEVDQPGPFAAAPVIAGAPNAQFEWRSAEGIHTAVTVTGELLVGGGDSSEVTINGFLFSGGRIRVPATLNGNPNRLQKLRILHCTLVPGLTLHRDGRPVSPAEPSLIVECPDTEVEISYCLMGGIRASDTTIVRIDHSVVDSCGSSGVAFAAVDGAGAGAPVSFESSTVIGKIHTAVLSRLSNSLVMAELAPADPWEAPVIASRRQQGCVRFSYLPLSSIVPRRYRCHPDSADEAARLHPLFNSLQYGEPGYAQLARPCPPAVWQGASDEAEMGVFHDLQQPQREDDLRTRLDEYLRFGLEAGLFHST